jgi:hypothetical protein
MPTALRRHIPVSQAQAAAATEIQAIASTRSPHRT